MDRRLELHELLVGILGSTNVYFQPPPTISMNYPCIVYSKDAVNTNFADNLPYTQKKRWQIKVIDQDPDSSIPDRVGELSMSSFDRHYIADNLNHNIYNLYF